ncbi:hypothetical protein [Crenothrix polyspora]|uniref:Uncharacterized protein n=1 Tax=Crenothrix polyspora TaxID=360316 RepID=A0A1R4H5W3_9GAMM|nr:hypothetical protein [Crenothrix polyspora]SJM91642.1 conserved hypothetical protein [Crenothrix polyspora]
MRVPKHLKVKISMDDHSDNMPKKSTRRLSALSIDTLAFKFDREEAAEDKEGLGSRIHRRFSALGGVELILPNRQLSRQPPNLLE